MLGVPELVILIVPLIFWLAVIGAMVWGLITLNRIRQLQKSMASRLEAIEAELRRERIQ